MGFHTFKWIIIFTVISAGLGVALSMLLQPGIGVEIASAADVANSSVETGSIQDTILGFVPTNIINSLYPLDNVTVTTLFCVSAHSNSKEKREYDTWNHGTFSHGINDVCWNYRI